MTQQGALAVTTGAAIWGLFWIPLRYLDSLGVAGFWAVAMVLCLAGVLPLLSLARQHNLALLTERSVWLVGLALGFSNVLYFAGVMISDVVRVVFLFYLLPVWTTIAARVLYQEPITPVRGAIIAFALAGLWLLLGNESGLPLPRNAGDWFGLIAGLCWGVSLAALRSQPDIPPMAATAMTFVCGGLIAVLIAAILTLADAPLLQMAPEHVQTPSVSSLWKALPAAATFGGVVLAVAMYSQVWGARLIPAPTASLCTMSEILVATVSASVLIGTDLTPSAWLGATIILLAALWDICLRFQRPVG